MNHPDVDEIVNYLSTKFNKIFCDREFVCCVSEDFQIVHNNKNKCCVLVFPVLGPIYLKALRYQAKIFDLAVIHLASGKFKSLAVCHKHFIKKDVNQEAVVMADHPSTSRQKRPERQLYVPPAQRASANAKKAIVSEPAREEEDEPKTDARTHTKRQKNLPVTIAKTTVVTSTSTTKTTTTATATITKTTPNNSISLKDLVTHLQDASFIPKWSQNQDFLAHSLQESCKSTEVPIFSCTDKLTFLQMMHDNKLSLEPSHFLDFQNNFIDYLQKSTQLINVNNIMEVPNKKPNFTMLVNNMEYDRNYFQRIMKDFDDYQTFFMVYRVNYHDKYCRVEDAMVKLQAMEKENQGHFFFTKYTDKLGYFYECSQQHDVFDCYKNFRKELHETKTNFSEIMSELLHSPPNTELPSVSESSGDDAVSTTNNKTTVKTNNIRNRSNNNVEKTSEKEKKPKKNVHEEEKEIMRKTKENINRKTRPIMKYVEGEQNDTLKIDKSDLNNWEDLFDETGQLQDELFHEISTKVGRKNVSIVKATEDYSAYSAKPIEELEHVVELYDFPPSLETHDLVHAFSSINSECMYVKWVDNTHALLVLGTLTQARRAVELKNSLIKARPMTAASSLSLDVAQKNDLKPAMKRPPTNLQTARRLITTHLGAKSRISREQNDKEREDLKAARELRKLAKKNEQDAWEGNFPGNTSSKN